MNDSIIRPKSKSKITIGMPIYNCAERLSVVLDSLLSQTYSDFTILISDNASTDNTYEICQRFATEDSRVIVHRQERNIGIMENFSWVLENADSEFFCWAADDDIRHDGFLGELVTLLDEYPEVGLACPGMREYIYSASTGFEAGEFGRTFYMGTFPFNSKFIRMGARIKNLNPHMMYGLFRRSELLKVKVERFDYWDVYMLLSIEQNTGIICSQKPLFYVGMLGKRIPYSITGDRFDPSDFLSRSWKLFYGGHNIVFASLLMMLTSYIAYRTSWVHNRRRRDSRKTVAALGEAS